MNFSNYSSLSDSDLNKLLREIAPKIGRFIWRLTGDKDEILDITQNTLIKIANGICDFKQESHFDTWVFRIAYNEGLRFLQKKKNNLPLNDFIDNNKEDIQSSHEKKELVSLIDKLINKMSFEKREVFTMFYYTDLPILKISEVLAIPEGTVKSRLNKVRNELVDQLTKRGYITNEL